MAVWDICGRAWEQSRAWAGSPAAKRTAADAGGAEAAEQGSREIATAPWAGHARVGGRASVVRRVQVEFFVCVRRVEARAEDHWGDDAAGPVAGCRLVVHNAAPDGPGRSCSVYKDMPGARSGRVRGRGAVK